MPVFLSHSSKDKAFVRRLAIDLHQEGIEPWLDEMELRAGESLTALETGIRNAGCLVVVLSKAANQSDWVKREIEMARAMGGVRILPVLIEDIVGPWQFEMAFTDFRVRSDYRRALYQLVNEIKCLPKPRYLRAKEAAREVKVKVNPAGQLFGLSHQGVATVYSLSRRRDWLFADSTNGASRLWITEFFDPEKASVQAYAVIDGKIHALPTLFLLDLDPRPVPDSVVIYSCALNEQPSISEKRAKDLIEYDGANVKHVAKRYTRFRPLPITGGFVDSDAAIARALDCGRAGGALRKDDEQFFTLAKLECDKRDGGFLIWKVSFFDPALGDSILTVGVDAASGEVRHPAMQAEVLNADFFHTKIENGNVVIDINQQRKAMGNYIWDILPPDESTGDRLTAGEALRLADQLLAADAARRWQLAFLSNTGIVESVVSRHFVSPEEGLMTPDGRAGQWVVEVYSGEPHVMSRDGRTGYAYDFQQILVTRKDGAARVGAVDSCAFSVPFSQCPLPESLSEAYHRARALAIRCSAVVSYVMSVSLERPRGGAEWCFRFYDGQELLRSVRVSGDGRGVKT